MVLRWNSRIGLLAGALILAILILATVMAEPSTPATEAETVRSSRGKPITDLSWRAPGQSAAAAGDTVAEGPRALSGFGSRTRTARCSPDAGCRGSRPRDRRKRLPGRRRRLGLAPTLLGCPLRRGPGPGAPTGRPRAPPVPRRRRPDHSGADGFTGAVRIHPPPSGYSSQRRPPTRSPPTRRRRRGPRAARAGAPVRGGAAVVSPASSSPPTEAPDSASGSKVPTGSTSARSSSPPASACRATGAASSPPTRRWPAPG